MKDVLVGINEDELSNLSLEIIDYADKISEIFDRITECVDRVRGQYDGEPVGKIINNYQNLAEYCPVIKDNIISYSDDLIALIKKMHENDKSLVTLFQEYTDEAINKKKSIEK